MPGVIMTEDGTRNGDLTNHDRDRGPNGSLGTSDASAPGKMQALDSAKAPNMANGHGPGGGESQHHAAADSLAPIPAKRSRMNDLPDEIVHIAEGYIPLSMLLSRLAQQTHNSIQDKVQQLARMQLPQPPPSQVNGNSSPLAKDKEEFDNSQESLSKKVHLLKAIQSIHGKWVKALVIANWSRESEMVTKLIDLKSQINEQLMQFDMRLDQIVDMRRNLIFARVPSPDLRTALQVLSCGNGDWMPDLGYIDPPTLTLRDHAKWLQELDTCLSIRLNLEDYHKIPRQFKTYSIGSGRATFPVKGEFEVDLTVADDDPEKQFWFIDFRFDFSPAADGLSDHFKPMLEASVNNALAKDGLSGCYDLLHEFVLSHKIGELRRQAYELGRSSWAKTISVEPLDRAVSIQYWLTRQPQNTPSVPVYSRYAVPAVPTTPKSWIIISVNSGRKPDGTLDPSTPSHLTVSWYRDGKQMKDVEIKFDHNDLSTEKLLKTVIAKHVEHILTSVHKKLRPAPRFANCKSSIDLHISSSEPGDSYLTMQVGPKELLTLKMEPTTGRFALYPHSKFSLQGEHRLNNSGKDPAEDGAACLENLRWHYVTEEIARKGRAHGWVHVKTPLTYEEVRLSFKTQTRDAFHPVCFQRLDIDPSWYVMLVMSLHGDEWWAFQTTGQKPSPPSPPSPRSIKLMARLHLGTGQPALNQDFWNSLTTYFAGVIAHSVDLQELHTNKFNYDKAASKNGALPRNVKFPSILIKLTDILPGPASVRSAAGTDCRSSVPREDNPATTVGQPASVQDKSGAKPQRLGSKSRKLWAMDFVELRYCGVQSVLNKSSGNRRQLTNNMDAIVRVTDREKFSLLDSKLGQDVLYNHRKGELCIRLRSKVGEPVLQTLKTRLQAVDRLVESVVAMAKVKELVTCEKITLEKVVFTYTDGVSRAEGAEPKRWRATLDLSKPRVVVHLEAGNPHLRMEDHLTRLANGPSGISALTQLLPITLPILTVLDRIQNTWRDFSKAGKCSLTVQARTLDWMILRYDMPPSPNRPRSLIINVRLRPRKGTLWWYVFRSGKEPENGQPDIFDQRLRKVWEARIAPWRALGTGAATEISDKALKVLLGLDQTVREVVKDMAGGGVPNVGNAQKAGHAQGQGAQGVQGQQGGQGQQAGSRNKPLTLD